MPASRMDREDARRDVLDWSEARAPDKEVVMMNVRTGVGNLYNGRIMLSQPREISALHPGCSDATADAYGCDQSMTGSSRRDAMMLL